MKSYLFQIVTDRDTCARYVTAGSRIDAFQILFIDLIGCGIQDLRSVVYVSEIP